MKTGQNRMLAGIVSAVGIGCVGLLGVVLMSSSLVGLVTKENPKMRAAYALGNNVQEITNNIMAYVRAADQKARDEFDRLDGEFRANLGQYGKLAKTSKEKELFAAMGPLYESFVGLGKQVLFLRDQETQAALTSREKDEKAVAAVKESLARLEQGVSGLGAPDLNMMMARVKRMEEGYLAQGGRWAPEELRKQGPLLKTRIPASQAAPEAKDGCQKLLDDNLAKFFALSEQDRKLEEIREKRKTFGVNLIRQTRSLDMTLSGGIQALTFAEVDKAEKWALIAGRGFVIPTVLAVIALAGLGVFLALPKGTGGPDEERGTAGEGKSGSV